jgi:hypothetical protein
MSITVGTKVRIERDETLYPSKGTWPQFRGKTGTVVEINLGEYGVQFGNATPWNGRPGQFYRSSGSNVAWFRPYEVCPLATSPAPHRVPDGLLGVG